MATMTRIDRIREIADFVVWWRCIGAYELGIPECLLLAMPSTHGLIADARLVLQRRGASLGSPDFLLALPCCREHGLALTIGSCSTDEQQEQRTTADALLKQGYMWLACDSAKGAEKTVKRYVSMARGEMRDVDA